MYLKKIIATDSYENITQATYKNFESNKVITNTTNFMR